MARSPAKLKAREDKIKKAKKQKTPKSEDQEWNSGRWKRFRKTGPAHELAEGKSSHLPARTYVVFAFVLRVPRLAASISPAWPTKVGPSQRVDVGKGSLLLIVRRTRAERVRDVRVPQAPFVWREESSEVTKVPLAESRRLLVMESKSDSACLERKDRKKMVKCMER